MRQKILVGVDIHAHGIYILFAKINEKGSVSYIASACECVEEYMSGGVITHPKKIMNALLRGIDSISKTHGVSVENILVSFNASSLIAKKICLERNITTQKIVLNNIDEKEMEGVIVQKHNTKYPNNTILANTLTGYTVDNSYKLKTVQGLSAKKFVSIESLVFSGFKGEVESLISAIEHAGFEIQGVYPSPLVGGLYIFKTAEKRAGCLFIDIDLETTSWCAFYQGVPYSAGVIPIGTYDICSLIAQNLGIRIQDAMKVVMDKKGESGEISGAKREIFLKIRKKIFREIEKEQGQHPPLSGGIVILIPDYISFEYQKLFDAHIHAPITYIEKLNSSFSEKRMDGSWLIARALISYHHKHTKEKEQGGVFIPFWNMVNKQILKKVRKIFE